MNEKRFARAVLDQVVSHDHQAETDHQALLHAIKDGRVEVAAEF